MQFKSNSFRVREKDRIRYLTYTNPYTYRHSHVENFSPSGTSVSIVLRNTDSLISEFPSVKIVFLMTSTFAQGLVPRVTSCDSYPSELFKQDILSPIQLTILPRRVFRSFSYLRFYLYLLFQIICPKLPSNSTRFPWFPNSLL